MPTVLALETSCDESAAALVCGRTVLAHALTSQVAEHALWGGVVPEIASRRHVEALPLLIEAVLERTGRSITDLDAVAATVTPGLAGALLVASVTGRTLARLHRKPFVGVHHLEAHLCSAQLDHDPPQRPYLVVLVSGGHTELVRVDADNRLTRLGRSHDDAAGEAFDKVARLLGLGYPGGPAIAAIATAGDAHRFALPKGQVSRPGGGFHPYDFSFSGLKTAMLRLVRSLEEQEAPLPVADLAASFERVVAEVLVERSCRCARDQGLGTLVLVGGVAANLRLRQLLETTCQAQGLQWRAAPLAYCTDNAAMVGVAACHWLERGCTSPVDLGIAPRWPLEMAAALYDTTACF